MIDIKATPSGLSSQQVRESREAFGSNKLPEKKLKTAFDFFKETFKDRLNQILIGMMLIFTILAFSGQGSFSEPLGIFVVLLAIAVISTRTGLKSQKSTKELKDKTSIHYCNVLRDGKIEHVNTEDKMLERVRDGVQKAKESAAGHKIAYENSESVQQKRLDQRMRDAEVEARLQELKKKSNH